MFGGDDDFFDIFPDIDGDGDHDIVDFLIKKNIIVVVFIILI